MAGKLEGDEQLLAVGLQHSRGLLPYTIYTHRDLKGLQIGELPVSGEHSDKAFRRSGDSV
jgi:hypothetical protein